MLGSVNFPIYRQCLIPFALGFCVATCLVEQDSQVVHGYGGQRVAGSEVFDPQSQGLAHWRFSRIEASLGIKGLRQPIKRLRQGFVSDRPTLAVNNQCSLAQALGFAILIQLRQHVGQAVARVGDQHAVCRQLRL